MSPYLHCCIRVAQRTTLGWSSHRTTCACTFPQQATSSPRFVLRASMPHPSTGHVRTLQSAPRPLTKQCSLFGPSGKMFRVNYWASASTQNLATPSFDINSPQLNLLRGDSMSLKGHRLLVKDVQRCDPAHRKCEGAHPRKGKATSTEYKE